MEKKYLVFVAAIFIWISGFTQKLEPANCDVRPVTSRISIDGNQLVYALPKNAVRITIKVLQTHQTPGPYAGYAEKYLNISDGVTEIETSSYKIVGTVLERNSYPDSSCYFCISCLGSTNMPFLQLNADGVILGSNLSYSVDEYKIPSNPIFTIEQESEPDFFYDLGAMRFVEDKDEEAPKIIQSDSTHVKAPVSINKLVVTTDEQNAKEAADFILKLRKRRLKLLVGLKDEALAVEGPAMKIMVEELERLEKKYLELFVGKSSTRELNYYFDFEPEPAIEAEQKIVGWFSPNSGLVYSKPDVRKSDFKPIILKSEVVGKIPEIAIQTMDNSVKNSLPIKYGFYYRIPGMVTITLQYLDQVIANQRVQIAQKGHLVPLPVEYLNSAHFAIEYYPETGALKKIVQKKTEQ